jgi:hypothetical protein
MPDRPPIAQAHRTGSAIHHNHRSTNHPPFVQVRQRGRKLFEAMCSFHGRFYLASLVHRIESILNGVRHLGRWNGG